MEQIVKDIKEHNLLENVRTVGEKLLRGLNDLQNRYSAQISGVRGAGTFCAIDVKDVNHRDKLISALKVKGKIYLIVK